MNTNSLEIKQYVQKELEKKRVMRKLTAHDIFGVNVNKLSTNQYTDNVSQGPQIMDFRKQGEYGERKFIKP